MSSTRRGPRPGWSYRGARRNLWRRYRHPETGVKVSWAWFMERMRTNSWPRPATRDERVARDVAERERFLAQEPLTKELPA
jgi:hypothetical protein